MNGSVVAVLGNVTIIKPPHKEGFVVRNDNVSYFVDASQAYFFPWGFVVSEVGQGMKVPKYVLEYGDDPIIGQALKNVSVESILHRGKVQRIVA